MIKIEKTEISGWEAAIRGMRNPLNSWEKSDSYWTHVEDKETLNTGNFEFFVGPEDLKLMKKLSKAGNDHAKYLRMIDVTVDITAPLYWWKEFDTYKVGTVANSCSTMHKIHDKEFDINDFSHEHLIDVDETCNESFRYILEEQIINALNLARNQYLKTKDKKYWWQMIQLLPTSYNQKRTVKLNYQVLKQMYFARRNHKLDEWHTLCDWMENMKLFSDICIMPTDPDNDSWEDK